MEHGLFREAAVSFWFLGIFSILVFGRNKFQKASPWHDIELKLATALAKALIDLDIKSREVCTISLTKKTRAPAA